VHEVGNGLSVQHFITLDSLNKNDDADRPSCQQNAISHGGNTGVQTEYIREIICALLQVLGMWVAVRQ